MRPSVRFCQDPKSAADASPPPKLVAPTVSSEKPMDVTTMAETIGGTKPAPVPGGQAQHQLKQTTGRITAPTTAP